MLLGELVAGQVDGGETGLDELALQLAGFVALVDADADDAQLIRLIRRAGSAPAA